MKYGGAAASAYEGPRPRQRVHDVGADYLLHCVVRLTEIVKWYQSLTEHLLSDPLVSGVRPFVLGGDEPLQIYLQRVEAEVMRQALEQTRGNQLAAAKLARTNYRRQFNRPPGCARVPVPDASRGTDDGSRQSS